MTDRRPPPILLVGAGPGHPDLLTLRAESALAAARVVVTDETVADLAAAFAPKATVLPAGPDPDRTARLLARSADAGDPAVRLYRGDPWLHPGFADDAAALTAAGAAYEAVPGPPAPLALAAEAGIAVHHRPRSVTVTLAPLHVLLAAAAASGGAAGRTLVAEVEDPEAARRRLPAEGLTVALAGGVVIVGAQP
jgi:siroheme synthase